MPQRMIVFLHRSDPLIASWVILDDAGTVVQSVAESPLTEMKDTEVVVIIPTQDILLAQVTLPKLNRQKLLQALPFALEEQLLDDVENLHFAIGEYQANQSFPVAVIAKEKMESWLASLKNVEISPIAILPDVFILPFVDKTIFVNTHKDICTVRTGKFSGFSCDKNNLPDLLNLALGPHKDENEIVNTNFSELQLIETCTLEIFDEPPINLLQGPYRAKSKTSQTKKIWLIAGFLMAAWIGLALLSNLVSFFILHHQISNIDYSIKQIYKKNFPQASNVSSPRERMQDKLNKLFSQANNNNFLALLSLIGKSLAENKTIHLQNLDFREKQLSLEIFAASFDSLDNFTNALTQLNLNVKRQNAAIQGTQVKATLLISAGAP